MQNPASLKAHQDDHAMLEVRLVRAYKLARPLVKGLIRQVGVTPGNEPSGNAVEGRCGFQQRLQSWPFPRRSPA